MQQKSNISAALWFIPLVAVGLALFLTLLGVAGWKLLRQAGVLPTDSKPAQGLASAPVAVPVVPLPPAAPAEEPPAIPQEVADIPADTQAADTQSSAQACPSSYVPAKIKKPTRKVASTPFQRGLRQCKRHKVFPCAWEDKTAGVVKQYWLMSQDGPITRGVYDMGGNLLSETVASVSGNVTSHTEQNTTWYFQAGLLVKIRTTPYPNCNFHDWFFINDTGKQDVCQCAYSTPDCCARSPYREGMGQSYCALFALDGDFCKP